MARRKLLLAVAMLAAAGGAAASRHAFIEIVDVARYVVGASGRTASSDVHASQDLDSLVIRNAAGNPAVISGADPATGNGILIVGNATGGADPSGVKGVLTVSPANSGQLILANGSNTTVFVLDGNTGLQSGPADLAEAFSATTPDVAPGTVMVISGEHAGRLAVSTRPYDRRVAGVVAGANEYPSAITLAGLAEKPNKVAVTLSGTVYTRVSSENGPVRAGDLLTTSSRPGVAMRATDLEASRGATIGKAMEDLSADEGLVLVLANLQ